jgi:hypothetical protein
VAVTEERELSDAYRTTRRAPKPQGQGLNDLYVRFYRMAERRIVEPHTVELEDGSKEERPGLGIVCYISNYSWLEGLSHPGMREHYLESFDAITIDCLNGDKYKTGKVTPEGKPDPSIFSTRFNREGIQVGTAIALMVRKHPHTETAAVRYRDLWGTDKLDQLRREAEADGMVYEEVNPPLALGYPFKPRKFDADYLAWPRLPELFPSYFSGVQTNRDEALVEIDRDVLVGRMEKYFDPNVSDDELKRIAPKLITNAARFDAKTTRRHLIKQGFTSGHVVRYLYRPFDLRWLYWHPETKLLNEKRSDYFPHVHTGNIWIIGQPKSRRDWTPPQVTKSIGCLHLEEWSAACFPLYLYGKARPQTLFEAASAGERTPNLTEAAQVYLAQIGADERTLFYHALAVLHAPAYRKENAGALRQDWPRVPLPAGVEALRASASLGEQVAALLDPETPVPGVTAGDLRPAMKDVAVLRTTGGPPDFAVTASWGYLGTGNAVMPAGGKVVTTGGSHDIYLNDSTYWRNVPEAVWEYTLGGYQVLKKWLSYRDMRVLARPLKPDEAREFMHIARRIAALLSLAPALDESYRVVVAETVSLSAFEDQQPR